MKYFLIYFIDYKKDDEVSIKQQYRTKEDAENSLENVAVDFIKELQGKQQAEICKQFTKTHDQILLDGTLGKGFYIKKENDNVVLYQKIEIVVPGYIFSSNGQKLNKVGSYGVTEVNLDTSEFQCSCNIPKVSTTLKSLKDNNCCNLMSELNSVIEGSSLGDETDFKKIFSLIKSEKEKNKKNVPREEESYEQSLEEYQVLNSEEEEEINNYSEEQVYGYTNEDYDKLIDYVDEDEEEN